jgi:hypothetical protein
MKYKIVFLAAINSVVFGGCSLDSTKDAAFCKAKADRFYQGHLTVDIDNPRSQYIIGCMVAKGYDFDISQADCDSRHPLPTQPTCYTSGNWLGWSIGHLWSR